MFHVVDCVGCGVVELCTCSVQQWLLFSRWRFFFSPLFILLRRAFFAWCCHVVTRWACSVRLFLLCFSLFVWFWRSVEGDAVEDVLRDVLKMCWGCVEDVLRMRWGCVEGVLNWRMSWIGMCLLQSHSVLQRNQGEGIAQALFLPCVCATMRGVVGIALFPFRIFPTVSPRSLCTAWWVRIQRKEKKRCRCRGQWGLEKQRALEREKKNAGRATKIGEAKSVVERKERSAVRAVRIGEAKSIRKRTRSLFRVDSLQGVGCLSVIALLALLEAILFIARNFPLELSRKHMYPLVTLWFCFLAATLRIFYYQVVLSISFLTLLLSIFETARCFWLEYAENRLRHLRFGLSE